MKAANTPSIALPLSQAQQEPPKKGANRKKKKKKLTEARFLMQDCSEFSATIQHRRCNLQFPHTIHLDQHSDILGPAPSHNTRLTVRSHLTNHSVISSPHSGGCPVLPSHAAVFRAVLISICFQRVPTPRQTHLPRRSAKPRYIMRCRGFLYPHNPPGAPVPFSAAV